jgi:hypothetical protein
MFKKLAKSRLVDFRLVPSRGTARGSREFSTPFNDNSPGSDARRSPKPALTCRWFTRNGRLECRWQAEARDEARIEDPGILSADLRVSLSTRRKRRSSR